MAKRKRPRSGSVIAVGLAGVLLLCAFVWFVHTMLAQKSSSPQRQVQTVQIIRPPPPPPPDQPPPTPPPQKPEEQLPKDRPEPEPKDDEPPPAAPLGIDADGSAGSDAFGLAARRGGSDLVGGSGGALFAWYTNRLKDAVIDRLSNDGRLAAKKFSVSVQMWIEPDGRIREIKLVSTTGNRELDQHIESALTSITRMNEGPPLEMPQPVNLRIVSHT